MRLGEWQQGLAGNKESPPQSKNSMAGMFYNDKTRQWEFGEEFIEVVNLLADLYDDGVALYNTMDIEIGYSGNAANAEEKTALTTEWYECFSIRYTESQHCPNLYCHRRFRSLSSPSRSRRRPLHPRRFHSRKHTVQLWSRPWEC